MVAESRQSQVSYVDIKSHGGRVEAESIFTNGHHVPIVAEWRQSQSLEVAESRQSHLG